MHNLNNSSEISLTLHIHVGQPQMLKFHPYAPCVICVLYNEETFCVIDLLNSSTLFNVSLRELFTQSHICSPFVNVVDFTFLDILSSCFFHKPFILL